MGFPIGTVTFLFTDIQGSTTLWENYPEQMRNALARHDALLRTAIEANDGIVFKTIGDAFCAAFATAPAAAAAAVEAQIRIHAEPWDSEVALRVRMGLHTGAVEHRDSDYFGPPVNRVARLMSTGHGGQILVSAATQELIRDVLPARTALLDLGPHRLKDLIRPEIIYQLQHSELPRDFQPLRSLNNPNLPNNLPQQVTSFVGREKEMADLKRLIPTTRLLTLMASGGTGKSRLSLQVAADLLDDFPDGVWFAELAAISEPSLVAPTVARLLDITEVTGEPILQTLTKALKSRRLLLILDNCEHLIIACAQLAASLMRSCPNVFLIASSREALNITGETVYPLRALAFPDPKKAHTIENLAQYDAVRLFVDRAAAVRPDFAVTNQNAPVLAHLCHRLDGIPLALELAAARVRSLSIEEINTRLDNRFRLLTGGSRNVLPRQQTLRALIDWSYDLLNEQEQRLFARLSVFSGEWTLVAAEAVCAGEVIEDWEVFDLLTALSDKSLVVCEADNDSTRYRLLETLREYGSEKLKEMQETESLAERHARFYAETVLEKSQSSRTVEVCDFPYLLMEADNIRAALDRLWKTEQVETAAAVSAGMRLFWTYKGWFREAYGNLERAAERKGAIQDRALCASVLKDAGWFAFLLGDLTNAERLTLESVEIAVSAEETELQAHALNNLGIIMQSLKDYPRAESSFQTAIDLSRSLDQSVGLASCLMNLGMLRSMQQDHAAAEKLFAEAKGICERQSDAKGMAIWLANQSDLALRQSNWRDAQSFAEQCLEQFRKMEHQVGTACALANLAKAAARLENHTAVEAAVREAVAICIESSFNDVLPLLLITLADSYMRQNKIENAARLLSGAMRLRTLLNTPASGEEQEDLDCIIDDIRRQQGEDHLTTTAAQFLAVSMDELIARLRPLV